MMQAVNIVNVRFEWEGVFPKSHMVIVVETGLHLNPEHPTFNLQAVNALIQAASAYVSSKNRQIDHFRLISVADGQVE